MTDDDLPQSPAAARCDQCGGSSPSGDGEALRCECGSLLARYVHGQLELKCRRCKRTLLLPATSDWQEIRG